MQRPQEAWSLPKSMAVLLCHTEGRVDKFDFFFLFASQQPSSFISTSAGRISTPTTLDCRLKVYRYIAVRDALQYTAIAKFRFYEFVYHWSKCQELQNFHYFYMRDLKRLGVFKTESCKERLLTSLFFFQLACNNSIVLEEIYVYLFQMKPSCLTLHLSTFI